MIELDDMGLPHPERRRSESVKSFEESISIIRRILHDLEIYRTVGGILIEYESDDDIRTVDKRVRQTITRFKSMLSVVHLDMDSEENEESDEFETDLATRPDDLSSEKYLFELNMYNSLAKQDLEKVLDFMENNMEKTERKEKGNRKGRKKKDRKNKKNKKDGRTRKNKKSKSGRKRPKKVDNMD
ncbi:uncharacterized protein [Ptychodera flava]